MVFNIEQSITIKATREKVFDSISTPEGIKGWWGADTDIKPIVNCVAEFKFADKYYHKILITDVVVNCRFEWKVIDGNDEWLPTTIVWQLNDIDRGITLVKLSHINFAEQNQFSEYCQQKWECFLESLRDFCESGCGKPWIDDEEAEKEKQFIEKL